MRGYGFIFWGVVFCIGVLTLSGSSTFAQDVGPLRCQDQRGIQDSVIIPGCQQGWKAQCLGVHDYVEGQKEGRERLQILGRQQ